MKILVTNGAYKHTLALVRSLGAAGHEVGVVAHRRAAVSFFSKYCNRRHVVKTTEKRAFVDEILTILRENDYDILLPVGLPQVVWLAERADEIRQFTRLPLADVDKIKLFEDKRATYELARKLNIPTPLTFFPKDRSDADICAAQLKPPIVVKHCTQSGNEWLKYANTAEEAVQFYEKMRLFELKIQNSKLRISESDKNAVYTEGSLFELKTSLRGTKQTNEELKIAENNENTEGSSWKFNNAPLQTSNLKLESIMFQEYLSGGGYGFFGLYDNGVFKQGFAHKRIREFPVSGGASCCAESIENEQLMDFGKRILEAVEWHGLAMVEFKMDENGQSRLLEVNPKLWGSFDLSVASGIPFAEKWVQLAMHQPISEHQDYQKGIQFSWLFDGDLKNGLKTGKFWSILRGPLFDKKTRTNLTWRDPLASLFLIIAGLKT
jgi:predicted ATP-grasp superfamily ATP-dependent carboligase